MRSMRPIAVSRFAHQQTCLPCRRQGGVALIVALVLIVALTMVAIVSLRITTLDLQMAKNSVDYRYALQVSEGSRILGTRALNEHILNEGSWTAVPDGISATPNSMLYGATPSIPDITRTPDLNYKVDGNGNGNTTDDGVDLQADIYISFIRTTHAPGTDVTFGINSGGGGIAFLFYDVRSRGKGANNARALTISHYRNVVRF